MVDKRIALCIASRGHPRLLFETLHTSLSRCALPTTTAVVGLDDDDPTLADARAIIDGLGADRIVATIAPREDSIGAVYNRCAAMFEADLYINGADDVKILTLGWDALLSQAAELFPDNIAMIGFGQLPFPTMMPALSATTRGLIDKMGYFMQPFTSYWWMDTWLYEIATMIGRNHYVPVDVGIFGALRTRGLRDLTHWACFFDAMRVRRRAIAESILSSPDFLVSAERRQELLRNLDYVCAELHAAGNSGRDPAIAELMETASYDAPDDERYRRIKARSTQILQELEQERARLAS
jgi:hypothetical protein